MTKSKKDKPKAVPNAHISSRVAYLHQAARYLQSTGTNDKYNAFSGPKNRFEDLHGDILQYASMRIYQGNRYNEESWHNLSIENKAHASGVTSEGEDNAYEDYSGDQRLLLSHIRTIAQKSRVKVPPSVKHTTCKKCSSLLIPGSTSCSMYTENASRGGRKPWADVFVIKCLLCNTQKRFAIGAERQPCKNVRAQSKASAIDIQPISRSAESTA